MLRLYFLILLAGLAMGCRNRQHQAQTPPAPAAPDMEPQPDDTLIGSTDEPTPTTAVPSKDLPTQGQPCPKGGCAKGLTCISYYGIAGPSGPKFSSCEIRCLHKGAAGTCPDGQRCVTIADGPGQVCRPN